MTNAYGVVLDDASLRWAAAESVPETVIAAICLLETMSVDEIVARLTPAELEQVIKIVGRSPRGYPPGALDALKGKRNSASPQPPTQKLALKPGQPGTRTNPGTEHSRIRARRFNAPRVEVPQSSTERSAATTVSERTVYHNSATIFFGTIAVVVAIGACVPVLSARDDRRGGP